MSGTKTHKKESKMTQTITIKIKQSKEGKWNPTEVEKAFKGLKKGLNGMELANLTEHLLAGNYINQICVDMFKSKLA